MRKRNIYITKYSINTYKKNKKRSWICKIYITKYSINTEPLPELSVFPSAFTLQNILLIQFPNFFNKYNNKFIKICRLIFILIFNLVLYNKNFLNILFFQ